MSRNYYAIASRVRAIEVTEGVGRNPEQAQVGHKAVLEDLTKLIEDPKLVEYTIYAVSRNVDNEVHVKLHEYNQMELADGTVGGHFLKTEGMAELKTTRDAMNATNHLTKGVDIYHYLETDEDYDPLTLQFSLGGLNDSIKIEGDPPWE